MYFSFSPFLLLGVTDYGQEVSFSCLRLFLFLAHFFWFQSSASSLPLVWVFITPQHFQGSESELGLSVQNHQSFFYLLLISMLFWFIYTPESLKVEFEPHCLGVIFKRKGEHLYTAIFKLQVHPNYISFYCFQFIVPVWIPESYFPTFVSYCSLSWIPFIIPNHKSFPVYAPCFSTSESRFSFS